MVELRADHMTGAYRPVYTVRYGDRGYVLHAFQKKGKGEPNTPAEFEIVRQGLKVGEKDHRFA